MRLLTPAGVFLCNAVIPASTQKAGGARVFYACACVAPPTHACAPRRAPIGSEFAGTFVRDRVAWPGLSGWGWSQASEPQPSCPRQCPVTGRAPAFSGRPGFSDSSAVHTVRSAPRREDVERVPRMGVKGCDLHPMAS